METTFETLRRVGAVVRCTEIANCPGMEGEVVAVDFAGINCVRIRWNDGSPRGRFDVMMTNPAERWALKCIEVLR